MSVTIRHEQGIAVELVPEMDRWPWSTCPGAIQQLQATFTGVALDAFQDRGEKRANCTHLHDLATLGAKHAFDREQLVYDVLVSDPIDGRCDAELRRNGQTLLKWVLVNDKFLEPAEAAGESLLKLNPYIASLDASLQEPARILRWGSMIAHGRAMSLEALSDASAMPVGNCFTFQAHVRTDAKHVGEIRDFSRGTAKPLDKRGAAA